MRKFQLAVACMAVLVATAGQVEAGPITVNFEFRNDSNDVVGLGSFQFDETLDGTVLDFGDLSSFQFSIPSPGSGTIYDLTFLNSGFFSIYYDMSFDTSTDSFQTLIIGGFPTILSAIKSDFNSGFFVRPADDNPLVADYFQSGGAADSIPYSSLTVERYSVNIVPEPASLAVFGICACVAGIYTARRRRGEKRSMRQEITA